MNILAALNRPRPMPVSVIGWLFVAFGMFAAFGGVFGAILSMFAPFPDEPAAELAGAPRPFQIMARMFDYFPAIAVLQVIVGAFMIWSGVAFLQLRRWGRTAIEVLTWIGLAYTLGFGAFWLWMVTTLWRGAPPGDAGTVVLPVFLVIGGLAIVVHAVLLGAVIRVVRGATVRAALDAAKI